MCIRDRSAPKVVPAPISVTNAPAELPLNAPRVQSDRYETPEPVVMHSSGFLGASEIQREDGGRQKTLAFAAVVLFFVMARAPVSTMAGPRGTAAQEMRPNAPLELVSLTHQRQ